MRYNIIQPNMVNQVIISQFITLNLTRKDIHLKFLLT